MLNEINWSDKIAVAIRWWQLKYPRSKKIDLAESYSSAACAHHSIELLDKPPNVLQQRALAVNCINLLY